MREEVFSLTGEANGLGLCYVAFPNESSTGFPFVLAAHGSGRNALSYRDEPFYRRQRDLALEAGCAFAAISNGIETWGTNQGVFRLKCLAKWMKEKGGADHYALWGSSAGGAVALQLAEEVSTEIGLILGMFPVIDLTRFSESKKVQEAWGGLEGPALYNALLEASPAGRLDRLPPVPVVVCHGTTDRVVPPEQHILRYAHLMPGKTQIYLCNAGHSVQALNLYETEVLHWALRQFANVRR